MSNLMENGANATISKTPLIDTKRSIFPVGFSRKMTMKASYIYPIFLQETIPGDTWNIDMSQFTRMATQVTAPMDNLWYDFYFFYFPKRLYWENFIRQQGHRDNPDDTIDYITPTITSENGFEAKSIYDYMGGIRMGQKGTKVDAIPFRAYNDIINQFFRASQVMDSLTVKKTDEDDNEDDYELVRACKLHDYFTDMLPSITAGNEQVSIPLGTSASLVPTSTAQGSAQFLYPQINGHNTVGGDLGIVNGANRYALGGYNALSEDINGKTLVQPITEIQEKLRVDLSNAVSASITAMRMAIDTQELLERDNRSGALYTDLVYGRYKVLLPDLMLYRPQLVGSMKLPVFTTPVVQTSGTGATGQATPQGNIAGYGTSASNGNVINVSCGEFGYIMGLACIRTVPQYQQGLARKWTNFERFDYYYPEFMAMSDQGVKRSELYLQDDDKVDATTGEKLNDQIVGYIGRYDHLRYFNNEICGEFRSDYEYTLDSWHYAEKFENSPELNAEFLYDDTVEVLKRSLAIQTNLDGTDAEQFLCDFQFEGYVVRELPAKAVPRTGGNILA